LGVKAAKIVLRHVVYCGAEYRGRGLWWIPAADWYLAAAAAISRLMCGRLVAEGRRDNTAARRYLVAAFDGDELERWYSD
jgi:hypothetical protein